MFELIACIIAAILLYVVPTVFDKHIYVDEVIEKIKKILD